MSLREGDKANFQTLLDASKNGDLSLVSAIRKSDGAKIALVCAMGRGTKDGQEMFYPTPLAVMVEGNPYELFEDPTQDSSETITDADRELLAQLGTPEELEREYGGGK